MEKRELTLYSSAEHKIDLWERELLALGAHGVDLSSLPELWEKGRARRLERASGDFFYFATTYFPATFFTAPFNKAHRWMMNQALRADRSITAIAAHRGFGKTMLFRVFKIWCALFGKRHFYGKVSDTIDLVGKDFRHVRLELDHNAKIISDFGRLISRDWNTVYAFFVEPHPYNSRGTLFSAFSTTVTARGELAQTRPDFLEFDDFEDFSTSINPDKSREKIEIIERDFLPALADNGASVLIGNNARTTCLFSILLNMPEADRQALHPAFEMKVIPAWDHQADRPTWHERYAFRTEEEMRSAFRVSVSVWKAEFQQSPAPPEGARFLFKHWATFERLPRDARGVLFCDPAMGEKSDFKAIAPVFWSARMRRFLVPGAFVRRCGWEEYFLGMYTMYERYGEHIAYIAWESNFFQGQFLEFQRLYASVKDRPPLPIRPVEVKDDKFWRIEQIETPFSMGNILFAADFLHSADGVEAQSQLIGYQGKKSSTHKVDFPDALASAYKLVWPMAGDETAGKAEYFGGAKRRFHERI